MSDINAATAAPATRRTDGSSRFVRAGYKAWKLIRSGKTGVLLSIPIYRCWWRLRGLDFGIVSIQDLGLDPTRANYHKDGGGPLLCDFLNQLKINENDAVLDMGSGKAGAMATLARYPFKAVHGIEISGDLCEAARKNIARLNLTQCAVFHGDAAALTDIDQYTYVFLFNPFPEVVMAQVLSNFEVSLRRAPRTLRIVYSNPLHEQRVLATGTFKKTFVYEPYDEYRICVYENCAK